MEKEIKKVETITINPSSINIIEGTWYDDLVTEIIPEDASNKNLTWTSDNPNVASIVTNVGCIYGVGVGETKVHATALDGTGVSAFCTVIVEPRIPVDSITLNKSTMTIGKGESWRLSAEVAPDDAFDKTIDWCSSNCCVADVDKNGVVTAKSLGTAVIYANAHDESGIVATCTVSVRQTTTCSTYETPKNSVRASCLPVPIDIYSGAHQLRHTVMKLFGGQKLNFSISYDSTRLAKGEVGIGWYHNYEKYIGVSGNTASVFSTPSVFSTYTAQSPCCNEFTCNSPDKNGYILTVDHDSTYPYVINCNSQRTEYYNSEGYLAKIVDHQGFQTTITRSGRLMTITDELSGKKIYVEKDPCCRIQRVYDAASRQATLSYTNDLLTSITDANGNTFTYTYDSKKRIKTGTDPENIKYFENTFDSYGRLIAQKDALGNSFVFSYDGDKRIVTDRNGKQSTRIFNSKELLIKYIDENANTTTYEYDSRHNVTKETDGRGYSIIKEYNSFNKPTKVTHKNGNVTTFSYDNKGNLTKITYPCIADEYSTETYQYNSRNQIIRHTDTYGTVTVYTYDANGMPLTKKLGNRPVAEYRYVNGLLVSETDAMGNETSYTHNAYGMVDTMTNADGKVTSYVYDKLGNIKSITDANNKTITNVYNKNYQKISVTDPRGNVTRYSYNGLMKNDKITLPDDHTVRYQFDREERVTKIIDQLNQQTVITYDAGGRIESKTLADGATIRYEYDSAGNVIKETNPKNATVTKTYDKAGNVLTVRDNLNNTTTYEYNEQSKPTRVTNALGGSIRYEYDPSGNVIAETDALNNRKTYEYDAYGNLVKTTDAKGNSTLYTYDDNNNLLTVTNALGEVTTYTYNCLNQCVSVTDAQNNVVSYEYDALGRRTATTDARGNRFTTEYDACGNVTKTIDADGNVITETAYNCLNLPQTATDATGKTLTYTYNVLGKVNTVTDALGNYQIYAYDVCGRNNMVTDDLGGISSATYDRLGNATKLQGPLGGATNYTYDDMGRLTAQSTTSGGSIEYQYNELNLRKKITNARSQNISFVYDANGRISSYTSPEDVVSLAYDDNGNIIRTRNSQGDITRAFDALNRVTSCTDTDGKTIGYEYDSVGNLVKLTYPDNTAVNYAYDENHNLVRVTDWANRVTTYTYDVNNRVVGVTKPDGSVTTTVYDNKQRVTSTVERTATGAVITGFEYTYDDLSRIIEEKVLANSTKMCYTYDSLSRVTARTVKKLSDNSVVSTETFNYDAAGNVTSAPDSSFQYDTNNRLISFNGNTVSYDLDGNMLSNGSLTCTYDSANRLVSAGGHTYTYNSEDVRIRNLCAEEDTTYTYNTNAKLSMLLMKTTNGVVTKYVYGKGLIGEEVSGAFKTYHFDCRGSTIAITDASGNITDTFAYDTYGKLLTRTGTNKVIFGYNGRDGVVTDDNGLIYMRARYYSPDMKRFINADIIPGKLSNAITLNRFAYANGNPVSFVDPFGLSPNNRWDKEDINYTWQELGFAYNGSMQDFRRLEQGLPPVAYEKWLKKGYGYSDDPYWDAILGNHDAFYVADYDYEESGGLPVVAHAYVLIKNSDGKWVKTEFGGSKKSNAEIRCYSISSESIISALKSPLESIPYARETQHIEWVFGFIPVTITTSYIEYVHVGGVQFVPIKGDFSKSVEMAYNKDGGNYGGYNLVSNNCLHYARDVLRAGEASSASVENIIENSTCIVPDEFYEQLYKATK